MIQFIVYALGFLVLAVCGAIFLAHPSQRVRIFAAGAASGMAVGGLLSILFISLDAVF